MTQLMRGEGIYPHGDEVTSRLQAVKVTVGRPAFMPATERRASQKLP